MVGVASERDSEPIAAEVELAARSLPNLELLAPRPRPELMELVARSVAIVSTSEYEGLANVMLEGWARGVQALSLFHDPDGVVESERLGACAGGSRERLATLAREMWRGRGRPEALAERCRTFVQREHDQRAVAERWLEALAPDDQRVATGGSRVAHA